MDIRAETLDKDDFIPAVEKEGDEYRILFRYIIRQAVIDLRLGGGRAKNAAHFLLSKDSDPYFQLADIDDPDEIRSVIKNMERNQVSQFYMDSFMRTEAAYAA